MASLIRDGSRVRPSTLARTELERLGASAVVEATGQAGDVLIIHPFLVHAPSSAHRATRDGDGDGAWVHHALRVTFNLATEWAPMQVSATRRNPLERIMLSAVEESSRRNEAAEQREATARHCTICSNTCVPVDTDDKS